MSDAAYVASVRRALDDAWKDVDETIMRNFPDVVLADRLRQRIANLVTAERALCDGDGK